MYTVILKAALFYSVKLIIIIQYIVVLGKVTVWAVIYYTLRCNTMNCNKGQYGINHCIFIQMQTFRTVAEWQEFTRTSVCSQQGFTPVQWEKNKIRQIISVQPWQIPCLSFRLPRQLYTFNTTAVSQSFSQYTCHSFSVYQLHHHRYIRWLQRYCHGLSLRQRP